MFWFIGVFGLGFLVPTLIDLYKIEILPKDPLFFLSIYPPSFYFYQLPLAHISPDAEV